MEIFNTEGGEKVGRIYARFGVERGKVYDCCYALAEKFGVKKFFPEFCGWRYAQKYMDAIAVALDRLPKEHFKQTVAKTPLSLKVFVSEGVTKKSGVLTPPLTNAIKRLDRLDPPCGPAWTSKDLQSDFTPEDFALIADTEFFGSVSIQKILGLMALIEETNRFSKPPIDYVPVEKKEADKKSYKPEPLTQEQIKKRMAMEEWRRIERIIFDKNAYLRPSFRKKVEALIPRREVKG
jgi:hypothetical protein